MDPVDLQKQQPEGTAQDTSSSSTYSSYMDHTDFAARHANLFRTPSGQTPYTMSPRNSTVASGSVLWEGQASVTTAYQGPLRTLYFKSRRVKKEEIERPWLEKPDPRDKWSTICPLFGLFVGLTVVGILVWNGIRTTEMHSYCEVLNDDFTSWNDKVWTKEVEVGGFGNGQFEMTTNTDENVFVRDGMLNIRPTLQEQDLVDSNNIIDLRESGCTGSRYYDCVIATNTTNGTIVNPVKSGRVNTKHGAFIKFGRIEVEAKLPEGDWLWPAIWMMPKDSVYGDWPRSGEIDIVESRGNNWTYAQGGNNIASSALHFGPDAENDGWWVKNVKRKALHTTYSKGFNIYGVEWTENYIYTYINTRLYQVLFTHFDQPFWTYGKFPLSGKNGTRIENPWAGTGSNASPFDQDFYLIISLAVGSTNGWFEDGKSGKPWINRSPVAKKDFWQARDQWYPTWKKNSIMQIKSVKMWQQSGHNGCNA